MPSAAFFLALITHSVHAMSKRKLSHDDKPHEQFATLKKSIPGLQATQCRKVVSLLNEGGKGRRTCSTASAQHDITHPLLQEVALKSSSDDKDITMHMLSVPGMVQSKADSDPLYRRLLQKALRENQNNSLSSTMQMKWMRATFWRQSIQGKLSCLIAPSWKWM